MYNIKINSAFLINSYFHAITFNNYLLCFLILLVIVVSIESHSYNYLLYRLNPYYFQEKYNITSLLNLCDYE